MDLGWEYNQDLVIEGHAYVLDFVDSYIENGESVIRRRFIRADGKEPRFFYKRTPLAVKAPAAKTVGTPEVAKTHTGLDSAALDTPETGKKPGLLKKVFGRKKKI